MHTFCGNRIAQQKCFKLVNHSKLLNHSGITATEEHHPAILLSTCVQVYPDTQSHWEHHHHLRVIVTVLVRTELRFLLKQKKNEDFKIWILVVDAIA